MSAATCKGPGVSATVNYYYACSMCQGWIRRVVPWLASAALIAGSAAACPELTSRQVSAYGPIRLHATRPAAGDARELLRRVDERLARSPLYRRNAHYPVFLCDDDWRWQLYSGGNRRAAAVARAPFVRDVIVRGADRKLRRYVQAGGGLAPTDRPLEYLLAHEITHLMVADALGARAYRRLPSWVNEGYADYVARGAAFDYRDAAGGHDSSRQTGAYLRYAVMVAHVLEDNGWTVQELLERPPDPSQVQREVAAQVEATH